MVVSTTTTSEIRAVHAVAYHRNGVCGEPFHLVTFTSADGQAMLATVFDERDGAPAVAIVSLGLLAEGNIAFGENSWRGDRFADELYRAIKANGEWCPGCIVDGEPCPHDA